MTNKNRDGLLKLPGSLAYIAVAFDHNGTLVREITPSTSRNLPISLKKLGKIYLCSDCQPILKYFITPEIEIERIFNCLRYKYLQAVHMTNVANPERYLHFSYNKAFQSLAGLKVYQGNPPIRKANDDFWREAGFAGEAKELDWQKERGELKAILNLLKVITPRPVTRMYAELIAIC